MTFDLYPAFLGLSVTSIFTLLFVSRRFLQWTVARESKQQEPAATNANVMVFEYKKILQATLQSLAIPPIHKPPPYTELTYQIFSRIKHTTPNQHLALTLSKIGAHVAISFYPLHTSDLHLLIGLYTAFYLVLDDTGHTITDQISQFRRRLVSHEPQSALFELLASLFSDFDSAFPPFIANKLFSGILSALSSLEVELDRTTPFDFEGTTSPSFPRYFRNMTGCSEAYVYFLLTNEFSTPSRVKHFLHAVPELWNLTDEINDLFSFYKESIVGIERDTYVYHVARAEGIPVPRVIEDLGRKVQDRVRCIFRIVDGDEVLGDLVRGFVFGQVGFYLVEERYRLGELGLG